MTPTETRLVPVDVSRLVIAARIVAYEDQSPEALKALDIAAEKFAGLVPWENEPDALPPREEATEGAGEFGDALLALLFRYGLKVALDVSEIEALRLLALRAQPQPEQGEASGEMREAVRLALEDADALERASEEADDNQWQDWAATMRQAASRIRHLAMIRPAPVAGEGERVRDVLWRPQ